MVQGVGAAAMFATTFALLNSSYQGRDRGTAYGLWGAVVGASAAIGPIIGGLLTQGLSWRWIFFVNLPFSVLAIVLSLRVFDGGIPKHGLRVDLPGTAVFTTAAGVLTYAMIRANDDGWATASTFGLLAISLVAFVLFFVIEARSRSAMLDLGLLRNKAFVGILIASLLVNFAAFSSFTYTSIWLQSLLGLSPIESGMTGLPLSVAAFAVSAGIGRFLHHRAPGPIIGTGMILIGLGALANAGLIGHGSSWPALILGFTIIGVGVGLATPTLNSSAMSAVPVHRGGMAAGAVTTVRQLGFAIGIALLGTLFATKASSTVVPGRRAARGRGGAQPGRRPGPAGAGAGRCHRAALDSTLHAAAADGLDLIFLVSGIAGIVGGLLVLILVRPAATARLLPRWRPPPPDRADPAGRCSTGGARSPCPSRGSLPGPTCVPARLRRPSARHRGPLSRAVIPRAEDAAMPRRTAQLPVPRLRRPARVGSSGTSGRLQLPTRRITAHSWTRSSDCRRQTRPAGGHRPSPAGRRSQARQGAADRMVRGALVPLRGG